VSRGTVGLVSEYDVLGDQWMTRRVTAVLSVGLVALTALAAAEDRSVGQSPRDQIAAVVLAAWRGPELAGAKAGLDFEAAASRVQVHLGSPYAEVEREGIGWDFEPEPTAVWSLRFGIPFNWPGQGSAVGNFIEATDRRVTVESRLAALDLAERAVAAWLDLAATGERIGVLESQLGHLVGALGLQRKRLELGEVSGHEVSQLELERARLVTELATLRSTNASAAAALHRLSGADAPRPNGPVLDRLLDQMPPFSWDDGAAAVAMEDSPWLVASAAEVERRRLEGKQAGRTAFGRPEFEVTWARVPDVGDLDGFDAAGLRLKVPLPLGQAGKRRRAESEAGVRHALARQQQTRWMLEARMAEAATRLTEASISLATLSEVEDELADVQYSLDQQYRLGVISYLGYLDGVRRLDDVRVQAIIARHAELRARLELAVLTGDKSLFPLPDFDEESLR